MNIASEQTGSIPAMAASIIHDLRNPLATIHGGAEMMLHARLSKPQIRRIARNIYGASVRMKELIEDLLERSSGGEEVECSDLRELVAKAVDKIALIAEFQSVRIVQDVSDSSAIALDRRRIDRVLVNLLVNAVEVMPDGGTIHISTVSEDGSVVIQVRDTGPGIAPEIRNRLFQPFVTARKASGLGLGLALSRQAVMDHGGEMWAESSPRGACFALRLPIRTGGSVGRRPDILINDPRSEQQKLDGDQCWNTAVLG